MLLFLAGAAGLLLLAGCQNDEITKYKAPRTDRPLNRILGAIIPHEDKMWFVKLVGPQQAVGEQEKPFQEFVQSIHFDGKEPIWSVPTGWKQEPEKKGAKEFGGYASFDVGRKDVDMTVSFLPPSSVPANIDRWRGMLGLARGLPADVTLALSQAQEVKLEDNVTATLVDLVGPGSGKRPAQAAAEAAPAQPAEARPAPLTFQTPDGWKKLPAGGFRVAAFEVNEKGEQATVTVIPLPGEAGTLLSNVNRWRNELKLPPTTEDQLAKDLHSLKVAGADVPYVDLLGSEAGSVRQRTLAVSVPRGRQTWFFKMHGPADLVGRQKTAFEAFVTSVRFPEGAER